MIERFCEDFKARMRRNTQFTYPMRSSQDHAVIGGINCPVLSTPTMIQKIEVSCPIYYEQHEVSFRRRYDRVYAGNFDMRREKWN